MYLNRLKWKSVYIIGRLMTPDVVLAANRRQTWSSSSDLSALVDVPSHGVTASSPIRDSPSWDNLAPHDEGAQVGTLSGWRVRGGRVLSYLPWQLTVAQGSGRTFPTTGSQSVSKTTSP